MTPPTDWIMSWPVGNGVSQQQYAVPCPAGGIAVYNPTNVALTLDLYQTEPDTNATHQTLTVAARRYKSMPTAPFNYLTINPQGTIDPGQTGYVTAYQTIDGADVQLDISSEDTWIDQDFFPGEDITLTSHEGTIILSNIQATLHLRVQGGFSGNLTLNCQSPSIVRLGHGVAAQGTLILAGSLVELGDVAQLQVQSTLALDHSQLALDPGASLIVQAPGEVSPGSFGQIWQRSRMTLGAQAQAVWQLNGVPLPTNPILDQQEVLIGEDANLVIYVDSSVAGNITRIGAGQSGSFTLSSEIPPGSPVMDGEPGHTYPPMLIGNPGPSDIAYPGEQLAYGLAFSRQVQVRTFSIQNTWNEATGQIQVGVFDSDISPSGPISATNQVLTIDSVAAGGIYQATARLGDNTSPLGLAGNYLAVTVEVQTIPTWGTLALYLTESF